MTSGGPAYISYYQLGGKLVGMRRANQSSGNGQDRIVGDHLGSVSVLVDTTPQIVQWQFYKPYGEIAQQSSGGSLTEVGYTGQRLDSDDGLMYYGARFYDPSLSYFVSTDPTTPDPSNPMDFERYSYARSNPLRYVDPSGYGPEDYYVFVNGCVQGGCNTAPDWGEYLGFLHELFEDQDWGKHRTTFEEWAFGDKDKHIDAHVLSVTTNDA